MFETVKRDSHNNFPRRIYDNGNCGTLYGFDWEKSIVIYRFITNGEADYRRYLMG